MSTIPTKKPYEIVTAFWHAGVFVKPGQPDLVLSEVEAKYHVLGGHIRERKADKAPVAPAVAAPAATDAVPKKTTSKS